MIKSKSKNKRKMEIKGNYLKTACTNFYLKGCLSKNLKLNQI